ncbi:MAG: response regulator [Bacteroidota bacterium]
MAAIKVAIVEDHKLFREGVSLILRNTGGYDLIGEFGSGEAFLRELDHIAPDVVIMDIDMPGIDGFETSRRALAQKPEIRILVLSMLSDEKSYFEMLNIGVRGFIIKESSSDELLKSINAVARGESYFSQELMRRILNHYNPEIRQKAEPAPPVKLTRRESEILHLIYKGKTNKQIADELFISLRTVEGHRARLLKKTATNNSITLMLYASRHGLLDD